MADISHANSPAKSIERMKFSKLFERGQVREFEAMRRNLVQPVTPFVRFRFVVRTLFMLAVLGLIGVNLLLKLA